MTPSAPPEDPDFEALLEFLRASRGFDFTGYKRTSLGRRIAKRMELIRAGSYAEYQDYLQVHPEEYSELFDTILINVTSFFRDAPAWRYVRDEVLPKVLAERESGDIRVWSAGCASGEEAYSIATLLVEALGEGAFRERVKIYATDVDDDALDTARQAAYPPKALEDAPSELVERCFERANGNLAFRADLRRSLIFGRNDLVQDAPISRIDLLLCRNVLMYFTAEAQARIVSRFHFALAEHGRLFLGKSEMLLTQSDVFRPVDLKCRVFEKVPQTTLRERLVHVIPPTAEPGPAVPETYAPVRDGAFDLAPTPQLVVDGGGNLALVNQRARALLGLVPQDLGRPLQDLEVSYRPVELRSAIERAYAERGPVALGEIGWTPRGSTAEHRFDVGVAPVMSEQGALIGASVSFTDVTAHASMRDELERSKRELEVAYEELQSTVEELETTNEELQSTNEELQAINDELRGRTRELDEVNAYLEGILTSLEVGIAVVDATQVVQVWNERAHDLWGLRPEEVAGHHFLGLDIGMPVGDLRGVLLEALSGSHPEPQMLPATNRRGRSIRVRVSTVPLSVDGDARGAIVVMEELERTGSD